MDDIEVKFVYPPDFDLLDPAEVINGHNHYTVECSARAYNTVEEVAGVKIHRDSLKTPSGQIPNRLIITDIEYAVSTMSVRVHIDNDDDETVTILTGEGKISFRKEGGFVPRASGEGTGNLLFTTFNTTAGESYWVKIRVETRE